MINNRVREIVGLFFLMILLFSCTEQESKSSGFTINRPSKASFSLRADLLNLQELMCIGECSEAMIDSVFIAMLTEDVIDSVYQINLHGFSSSTSFTRSLYPNKNWRDHFIIENTYSTGQGGDDCVSVYFTESLAYNVGELSNRSRYLLGRKTLMSDLQKIDLEYIYKQY